MKQTILFLFALISFNCIFGQEQMNLKTLNDMDSITTRAVVNKMLPTYEILPFTKYDLIDQTHSNKLTYSLKNKEGKTTIAEFEWRTEGGNRDLHIKGRRYYVFLYTSAEFLDLFPFWKSEVDKEATTDKTYNENACYTDKNTTTGVWLNFYRAMSGTWYLKNMSDDLRSESN